MKRLSLSQHIDPSSTSRSPDDPVGATSRSVIVVETGDYEQRYIFGVYADRDAARRGVRASYGDPYVVEWEDHSIKHLADYDFTEYEVQS